MSLKELKDLLKVLRSNGVTEYLTPELQLKLTELEAPKDASKSSPDPLFTEIQPSEDDLLFYSSAAAASK